MNEITDKMLLHLDLMLKANETTNLTAIKDREQGILLHIEDSLAGLPEFKKAPEGLYADLGTGGGFPGITLALATGRQTYLVDSVRKKTEILDSIIQELHQEDTIQTYWGRIEDFSQAYKGQFSVVTARALSQLVSLMELTTPLLKYGGQLICYKANVSDEELNTALHNQNKLGMKLVSQRKYTLSDQVTERTILVFEKVTEPKIKLPRKLGDAQKNPLK